MIIQFHTPKGIVVVDSETVTDVQLAEINLTREGLNHYLAEQPRNLAVEIDEINAKLKQAGIE